MDLTNRPLFRDFQSRVGSRFVVRSPEGNSFGEWSLNHCELLPKPPLEELADADCFALSWIGKDAPPQSVYEFEASDGFKATLLAVPVSPGQLWVTIN